MPTDKGKGSEKILRHPDKDEIVRRLTEGESVRNVHKWLSGKYANYNKKLKISVPTLQMFRKEVLKIDGQVLEDLNRARKEEDKRLEAEYVAQAVKSTNAYKDRLAQIADKNLDVASRMIQLDAVIGDRIEHWYNLISAGEALPDKADYELRKYIDQQMQILRDWKKLIEGIADKRVDYNVNITVMNEQLSAIQTVIKDVIYEELGVEKAMEFMDKLSNRLNQNSQKALPENIQEATFKQIE